MEADLRLRSHGFSPLFDRLQGDVPPMCLTDVAFDAQASGPVCKINRWLSGMEASSLPSVFILQLAFEAEDLLEGLFHTWHISLIL